MKRLSGCIKAMLLCSVLAVADSLLLFGLTLSPATATVLTVVLYASILTFIAWSAMNAFGTKRRSARPKPLHTAVHKAA